MRDKLPLDEQTVRSVLLLLTSHDSSLNAVNKKLSSLLQQALDDADEDQAEDSEWFEEAFKLLRDQKTLQIEQANNAFFIQSRVGTEDEKSVLENVITFNPELNKVPDMASEFKLEQERNRAEGTEDTMTEEELAEYFKEKKPKKKREPSFKSMTLDEIEEWEEKQDNSNDIYKVSARVKNAARSTGGNLTEAGVMLCNTFTHVLLALYAFANTIEDKTTKIKLIEVIRKQEGMPGTLINAAQSGVKANE